MLTLNDILDLIKNEPELPNSPTEMVDIEITRIIREQDKEGFIRLLRHTVVATKKAIIKRILNEVNHL